MDKPVLEPWKVCMSKLTIIRIWMLDHHCNSSMNPYRVPNHKLKLLDNFHINFFLNTDIDEININPDFNESSSFIILKSPLRGYPVDSCWRTENLLQFVRWISRHKLMPKISFSVSKKVLTTEEYGLMGRWFVTAEFEFG